jgi:hypothetical protein
MKLRPYFPAFALAIAALVSGCQQPAPPANNAAPAPASTSKPAEPVRGYVRALHLVPGLGPLSITVNEVKIAAGLTYGNGAPFAGVHDDRVKIAAFGGDGKRVAGPIPVRLKGGEDLTVLVTGVPGDVALLPWKHKNHGPVAGKAKVAVVHAAKALPAVDILLDGKSFRRNVKFGIATDYITLAPGRHVMQVTYDKSIEPTVIEQEQPLVITKDDEGNILAVEQPTPIQQVIPQKRIVTLTQDLDLAAGKVYSVALFHDEGKRPRLRVMEDKFTPDVVRAPGAD